ncbi:PREDICTED: protein phosphatase 1 regulatory subunit 3A-like [Cyprinodon variegatus]|uniref:Protein phosphatase 1 regulatory subunit 3A-like n=1 Tax=Cyprinodon variegatus TaxID=28743 RepID=A0A3Q2GNV1_CYPVA|nr:PREDICTED: protein phosphatase 1 regulatory subunit 3A-like [Cyprinodon variegatus]
MEFAGQLRASEACNYLAVPGLSPLDPDEDEGDLIVGFRPRSSPIPSRRCSTSDEDSDPEPPFCGSRRVSFADAKGLSLVQVKEFNTSDVPKLPGYDFVDGEGKDSVEYHLSPLTFSLPLSPKEVFAKVLNQKVELETVELLPGTTILKGVIRVLNISYNKSVYIRTSLDRWATHFDLLAEYVSGSSDGVTDSFSFKLTLVPPFGDQGVRVDFCLRYETPVGTFWSNNNNANYVLSCQRRMKEGIEKLQRENANKKSCLKAVSQSASTVENISSKKASSQEKMSTDESAGAPEVGTLNIPEGQSATSNAEEQTLLMENKQNSSRRRKRQAARMARLRSYYAQREGGEDDAGKDNKPKETPKQETLEEIPGDNVVSLQPLNEGKNKPENDQFVYEDLGVSSIPQYNDAASNQQVKSDSDVLARAESASGISTKSLPSAGESAAAEPQHFIECFTTNQDGDGSLGRTNGSGTASSEILINKTDGVTFGMVVAPLYSQAFEKVSAEKTVSSGNFTLPSKTREICGVLPVNTGSSMGEVQGNVTDSQGSNDLVIKLISPTSEDQEAVNKILKHTENVENPTEMEKQPDQNAIYSSLNLQSGFEDKVPPWSLYPQTEADEEILANKATKPGKYKSPEQSPPVVSVNEDETPAEDEPKVGLKPQIILEHNDEGGVQHKNYESTEVKNKSYKTYKSSIEDKLLQNLDELNCNQTDGRGFMESVEDLCEPEKMLLKSQNTCLEIQEKKNMENKDISGSENDESNPDDMHVMYEAAQSILNEVRSSNHYHAETSGRLHDQDVQEKKCEMEPSFSNQDENLLIDEGKNWETMVEEEEVSVLSNEEEGEQIDSKTEANKTNGKEIKEGSAVALERKVKQGYVIMADRVESTEEDKMDGQEAAELQDEAEFDSVGTEKVNVEDKEEKMEIEMKEDILTQWNKENGGQKISDFKQIIVVTADSEIAKQDREDKVWAFKLKSDFTGNKDEDGASALVSRAANKDISEGKYGCVQMDTSPSHEAGLQDLTDQSNGMFHSSHRGTYDPVEEADSASAESDSDEELQLYVHCLRAAGASAQAHKAKARGAGFTAHKKTSVGKVKVPPTLMPSISEALDEEQQQRFLPETHKDIKIAAEATSNPQQGMNQNQWRWKEVFSCSNVSKSLLYASLMVVFSVVAYHYDFLACFLLYLISVIWLCCQGEKPPIKNKQKD